MGTIRVSMYYLDLQLAEHTTPGGMGSTYDQYICALKKRDELKSSLATLEQRALLLEQLVTFFPFMSLTPPAISNYTI